ncbi:MAG: PaaI family thioesterase [Treponema sp.]|nr:PaaI family thioesterase [Treponema sp.]MCL2250625.1 PaaI family thioesterase [Treponema sp.]
MKIDLEHIRNHFKKDRFATGNGIVIDSVTEESAVCSLELNESHKNSIDNVQGGAIFTLADLTFAVHSNLAWVCGENVGVTVGQSCSISYLKSTKGSRLIASSACLSKGRSISVYRISVKDDLGVLIAEMIANAFTIAKH